MENTLQFEYAEENGARKTYRTVPRALISEPTWALQATDVATAQDRNFYLNQMSRIFDDRVQRFLCVTIYVMNADGKFLLLFHKKLQKWMPPGGKVDCHETPDESAIRECLEETGVEITLIGDRPPIEGGLMTPIGVQLNPVVPQERDHVDLIYAARPVGATALRHSEREAEAIGWYSCEEIAELNTFPSVLHWCQHLYKTY